MNTEPTNTNPPIQFLFERPADVTELNKPLNVVLAIGALASRMTQEQRTRTIHPDGRRENVAEHSYMLAKVATALAADMYPWMDRGKIALYAISHDDTEAYVGDTPTDVIAKHDVRLKEYREALGLAQLASEYQNLAPSYVADTLAYEQQQDYEAQFVRIMDKFMVLLIHIPNNGEVLRQNYTFDEFVAATHASEQKLLQQYPHFIELIQMRTDLALYIGDKFYE